MKIQVPHQLQNLEKEEAPHVNENFQTISETLRRLQKNETKSAFIQYVAGVPTVIRQQGNWVNGLTDNADGDTSVEFKKSAFAVAPEVSVNTAVSAITEFRIASIMGAISVTAVRVITYDSATSLVDTDFYILAKGN